MSLFENLICRAAADQTADEAEQIVQGHSATRVAWLVLNIWPSHLGLPLLIITIFVARNIRRHATFINLCVTWIIVGLSSSLLLYAGFQTGPEPPRMLCLAQASLLYGQPGLTSLSAFALVFQVFYVMWAAFKEKDPEHRSTLRKWILLVVPYVGFVLFATWTAFVGYNNPSLVTRKRRFFYCSVKDSSLTNSITAFSLGVLFITVCLELWILYMILSHWRVIRASGLAAHVGTDLSLICRIAAFTIWILLGIGLSGLAIRAPRSAVPDMALATMGTAVFLVFGTQHDFLRTWMFWRRIERRGRDELRQPAPMTIERIETGSSELLTRRSRSGSSPSSDKARSLQELERRPIGRLTTKDISRPVLREDLTFTIFGQAI